MSDETLRLDVLLHRLCLTRSRSEAKVACESGAVSLDGRPARPSDAVGAGRRIAVRYPSRTVEVEVLEVPGKNVSKKGARELYRIVGETRSADGDA